MVRRSVPDINAWLGLIGAFDWMIYACFSSYHGAAVSNCRLPFMSWNKNEVLRLNKTGTYLVVKACTEKRLEAIEGFTSTRNIIRLPLFCRILAVVELVQMVDLSVAVTVGIIEIGRLVLLSDVETRVG